MYIYVNASGDVVLLYDSGVFGDTARTVRQFA